MQLYSMKNNVLYNYKQCCSVFLQYFVILFLLLFAIIVYCVVEIVHPVSKIVILL